MPKKIFKILLAVLFIPIVIASTKASLRTLENLSFLNINLFLLIGGFFIYPVFHIVFLKPMYIYTLGHEVVHVLATWLCGGKVTSFHISREGGSVTTSKSNSFISLSPYFVPIHTIFLVLVYWILSRFFDLSGFNREIVFFIGFTMSFHVFMTVEVMKVKQPDMFKAGYLFSVLFIYLANIIVVMFAMSLMFKSISFVFFVKKALLYSKNIYKNIFETFIM